MIVVLSHLGYSDGGYGIGLPVYGDQTLADKLNKAGKPVHLILGGHSHRNLTKLPRSLAGQPLPPVITTAVRPGSGRCDGQSEWFGSGCLVKNDGQHGNC